MPVSNAAALRLRTALDEYVRSVSGDTGTRRGRIRDQVNDDDRQMVEMAQGLMQRIDGGDAPDTPRDTPGSRARDRAAAGQGQTSAWADSNAAARALFGQPGAAAAPNTPSEGNAS